MIKEQEVSNVNKLYKSACYCTNMRRSTNMISAFYDSALKEVHLTVAQYYLLINLSRLESANITHWAEHVGLDRSTMVRNIKPLLERELIESTEGHGKTFTLSSKGKSLLEQAIPMWQNAQTQIEEVLGEDDIDAIFRICEKLQNLNRLA